MSVLGDVKRIISACECCKDQSFEDDFNEISREASEFVIQEIPTSKRINSDPVPVCGAKLVKEFIGFADRGNKKIMMDTVTYMKCRYDLKHPERNSFLPPKRASGKEKKDHMNWRDNLKRTYRLQDNHLYYVNKTKGARKQVTFKNALPIIYLVHKRLNHASTKVTHSEVIKSWYGITYLDVQWALSECESCKITRPTRTDSELKPLVPDNVPQDLSGEKDVIISPSNCEKDVLNTILSQESESESEEDIPDPIQSPTSSRVADEIQAPEMDNDEFSYPEIDISEASMSDNDIAKSDATLESILKLNHEIPFSSAQRSLYMKIKTERFQRQYGKSHISEGVSTTSRDLASGPQNPVNLCGDRLVGETINPVSRSESSPSSTSSDPGKNVTIPHATEKLPFHTRSPDSCAQAELSIDSNVPIQTEKSLGKYSENIETINSESNFARNFATLYPNAPEYQAIEYELEGPLNEEAQEQCSLKLGDYCVLFLRGILPSDTEPLRVACQVARVTDTGNYEILTQWGIISEPFSIEDLSSVSREYAAGVSKLFLKARRSSISMRLDQFKQVIKDCKARCSCKKGCSTRRCPCRKIASVCTSLCEHLGSSCRNYGVLEPDENNLSDSSDKA